jgi:cell division protein FtsQ
VTDDRRSLPMSDEPAPQVLEELLKAFGGGADADAAADVDFDDPAIDEMLGIGHVAAAADDDSRDATAGDETAGDDDTEEGTAADDERVGADTDDHAGDDASGDDAEAPEAAPPAVVAGADKKVIVIDDDGLPDTEYLDADHEVSRRDHSDGADRSTIVIGDADDATVATVTIANSSMEPRLRERRIAVSRAAGRKRLRIAAILAAVLLVLGLGLGLLATNAFGVKDVRVEGVRYANQQQMQAIVDEVDGSQLLLLDTRDIEQRLERIAWVESARVDKDFPNSVVLDIRERVPVAFYQGADGRVRVIDAESRVLDVIEGLPVAYVQLSTPGPDLEPGQFAGAPYAVAASVALALPSEVRALLTSMAVDGATGDLSLLLDERINVRFGDGAEISDKLRRLLQVVRNGVDDVTAIDVTSDDPSVTRSG